MTSLPEGPVPSASPRSVVERIGFIVGPLLAALMLLFPPPDGMSVAAWRTAAVAVLMATWWITESVPIPVTALIPLVAFPLLGVATGAEAAAPYANPIIYLFLGGFVLAIAIEHSGLHRRLALAVMRSIGSEPSRLVAGMLAATAFISMWISNTAATLMMLPLAMSVLAVVEQGVEESKRDRNFAICMVLAAGYGSTIGGIGTLIGTPPNALLAAYMLESYGIELGFARWMMLGVPMVAVSVPLSWLILTRIAFPVRRGASSGGRDLLESERRALGPVSRTEWTVAAITALTAIAWIVRPLIDDFVPGLSDTTIAIAGALLIFLVPIDWRRLETAITWRQAERMPWAVLVLFGGGLSLAAAVEKTGLATWISGAVGPLSALPLALLVLGVATLIIFLSELTSNTATAATFLPVATALAVPASTHPLMLAIPAVLAASTAFMLPVGTPPNAIVFATGRVTMKEMVRGGLLLNLLFMALITGFVMLAVPAIFDVSAVPPQTR